MNFVYTSVTSHTFIILLLMMVLLEMHVVVRGYENSRVYGSQQPNPVREGFTDRVQPSWRWKNRNRPKPKRNRLETTEVALRNLYLRNDLILPIESIQSCCPTVNEMVEPIAGRNGTGYLVDLYQDEQVRQRFYEVSCHPKVVNKPCKFLEKRHSKMSQCVQQHSLTYALVRPTHVHAEEHPWTLDYITVRTGCTCEVVNLKRARRQEKRRH